VGATLARETATKKIELEGLGARDSAVFRALPQLSLKKIY